MHGGGPNAPAAARNMKIEHEGWTSSHPLLASWSDGDAMFQWWIEDSHTKGDPDQTVIFE
uniref:Uncharacterized protein n=1 Tax=viral metagenome TaxID=1070528 RepID=A0A6M3KNZ3_9ZZZZ